MPHWDFKCTKCGIVHDIHFPSYRFMIAATDPFFVCPEPCRGKLERQISAPAIAHAVPGMMRHTQTIKGMKVTTSIPDSKTIDDFV